MPQSHICMFYCILVAFWLHVTIELHVCCMSAALGCMCVAYSCVVIDICDRAQQHCTQILCILLHVRCVQNAFQMRVRCVCLRVDCILVAFELHGISLQHTRWYFWTCSKSMTFYDRQLCVLTCLDVINACELCVSCRLLQTLTIRTCSFHVSPDVQLRVLACMCVYVRVYTL